MSKLVIRLITLALSIAMLAGLSVGCGGKEDVSSSSGANPLDKAPTGVQSDVKPQDYAGTEITFVTWKDPELSEDGPVVKKFEKDYGIKVNIQLVEQAGYVKNLAADVASGKQGDIFFENGTFPGSLTVMQPLDAAKLDLTDPIWNQGIIKASTLEGKPYLVDTLSNVWAEVDICVYNKALFENNNITSPKEYYEAGKWTFANMRYAAQQIKNLGSTYVGVELLGPSALGAAGSTLFKFADNKFSLNMDAHYYETMNFFSQLKADGLGRLGRTDFQNGLTGMAFTNCFGLKKTGYYKKINPDHLGATFLPKWDENSDHAVTGIYRGWGLIDGAKNPVAAGLFLREYLDVNNYDLEKTFHNEEVANFFFQATGKYSDNMIYYRSEDLRRTTGLGRLYDDFWNVYSPSQIRGALDSEKNTLNLMVEQANKIVEEEIAIIKKG